MKRTLPLPGALAFVLVSVALVLTRVTAQAAAANPDSGRSLPVESKISAVTVYTDRAVVTRNTTLNLVTGGAEATFDKLPATLLDQSLTVSAHGTAQATILDVTARATYVDFTPNERVKSLEDELRGLQKQRRVLDDRGALLKSQEASLTRIENAATTPPTKDGAPRLTLEESTKLLAFLEEQRAKLSAERQSLDTQLENLAAKQAAIEHQLNEVRGAGGRSYKTVVVRLDASSAGTLDLALSYAVPGASWTPNYDARVNSGERAVELTYFGIVRQNTSEDWKDVALTLSTARPSLGGAAPQIQPWAVDVFVPRPKPAPIPMADAVRLDAFEVRSAGRAGKANADAAPASEPEAQKEASFAFAAVESGTTSASFKLAASASIPSDNSPQKAPITTAKLTSIPEYLTVPKKLAAAFLTSKVSNTTEFPLLPGAMNVFLDGTFVATSSIATVMPGEKFDLALGADEGISVKHRRVNRFTEDTGLTHSGKRVTYEYLITIQNNKKTAERVVVTDQVPISRNEKIGVKVIAPSEKDMKPTNEGTIKWTLELKPGDKRELTLKFSVDYPNDIQVSGLD